MLVFFSIAARTLLTALNFDQISFTHLSLKLPSGIFTILGEYPGSHFLVSALDLRVRPVISKLLKFFFANRAFIRRNSAVIMSASVFFVGI